MDWIKKAGTQAVRLASQTVKRKTRNRYYSGPASDHFDGQVFFNPQGVPPGKFTDLLRWRFGEKRAKWPSRWLSPHAGAVPQRQITGTDLRVTMVGHATMLIQTGGMNILTDPVWSNRVSPVSFVGPRRVNPPGIAFDDLPPVDLVLLTHNHYDHCDLATLKKLKHAHDPIVVTPLGNDAIISGAVAPNRIITGDWGESCEPFNGLRVHFEPCHHWSARAMNDRRMALWAAFVIETPGGKIYHIGDTGFHGGRNYRDAGQKHGGFRLAILPFGAYEPRWFMKGQHQDPDEAVEGFALCGATHAIGHHWGTFQLTDEAISEPRDRLWRALDAQGIDRARFAPLVPGETWIAPPVAR